MSRLVRKPKLPETQPAAQTSDFGGMYQPRSQAVVTAGESGDDYLTRMVKYIPAEIVGCSLVVNSILA